MSLVRSLCARLLAVGLLATAAPAAAQSPATPAPTATADTASRDRLRVFLDCQPFVSACQSDYYVVELPFASWTRDRLFADVHLLVSSLESGNGGREFTITYIGRERFAGTRDTMVVRTLPGDSEDNVRSALATAFRRGLFPFARRTTEGARLRVVYDAPAGGQPATTAQSLNDRWNLWVFETNVGGFVSGESLNRFLTVFSFLNARRITERTRVELGAGGDYQDVLVRFDTEEGRVESRNIVRNSGGRVRAVRSLGPRWSIGGLVNGGRNDFSNIRLSVRAAPVIEYNLFPWSEATKRQVIFAYGVGPVRLRYLEPTIYGQTVETRLLHHLQAGIDTRLSWGSIEGDIVATQYLHNTDLWRVTAGGDARLNLAKGLSISIGGRASRVSDLIFLSAQGATDQQALLQQRARATNFRLNGRISVNYTFGSIYNTIVNPRLERFNFGPGGVF